MQCVACGDCTVIDEDAHAHRICRPCTLNDVVSTRGSSVCGNKACLLKLKYDTNPSLVDAQCNLLASDAHKFVDFKAGSLQMHIFAFYAGGGWAQLWTDNRDFVPDTFRCVQRSSDELGYAKWISLTQFAIDNFLEQRAEIIESMGEPDSTRDNFSGQIEAKFTGNTRWNGLNQYSNHETKIDQVRNKYMRLNSIDGSNYASLQSRSHRLVSSRHAQSAQPRAMRLAFWLSPLHNINVTTIELTFTSVATHTVRTLSVYQHITGPYTTISYDLSSVEGSLTGASVRAHVHTETTLDLHSHDSTAKTVLITRIILLVSNPHEKQAYNCSILNEADLAYEIDNPTHFDTLYTQYKDQMCLSNFGV